MIKKVTCQYASSSLLNKTPLHMRVPALSWYFMVNRWNQSWNNNQVKLWLARNQTRLAMKGKGLPYHQIKSCLLGFVKHQLLVWIQSFPLALPKSNGPLRKPCNIRPPKRKLSTCKKCSGNNSRIGSTIENVQKAIKRLLLDWALALPHPNCNTHFIFQKAAPT